MFWNQMNDFWGFFSLSIFLFTFFSFLFPRMIDSAQAYDEAAVGGALQETTVPREDIFIVSKVHPRFLGYEQTLKSVERSLEKLKVSGQEYFMPSLSVVTS